MTASDDFLDLFAPEPQCTASPDASAPAAWKVLLVDDEADIHAVLHLALKDMQVEGKPLQLLDAHSASQAKEVLAQHPDVSLILLDVVMESEIAGLSLVRHIRRDICNRMVQIVLVTGQPGYAPQRDVVTDYEIDGYRLKSELTADKIFVSVYVALRTFKALRESDAQRRQVESMAQILGEKEQRLRSVVDTAPDAIIQADTEGTIIGWNDGATHLFGYAAQAMLGKTIAELLPRRYRDAPEGVMARLRSGTSDAMPAKPLELVGLRKNGGEFPMELVLGSWTTAQGPHYSAVIRDITERKQAESGLRLAASVYANSYEGIIIADPDKTIVDVNPAFTRITGYTREQVIGKSPKLLASGRHDAAFFRAMTASLADHDFWQGEICNRRFNGEIYTEILSLSVIRDNAGQLQHYIGVFSDISLLKAHEEELYRIAHFDLLTGVPNRRLLSDRLGQALARSRRTGRSVAVCYLDLDGFKAVNDRFGHAGGDKLLVEITDRLRKVLRSEDTLARLGGDEFVLLFTDIATTQEIPLALNRVLEAINLPVQIDDKTVNVSASVGVTLYPTDDVDADTLLRHADQAMYLAKEAGKNSYHFFDPAHDRQVQTQRHYMQRLREALDQQEFVLFYQPKAHLVSGDIVGFEALIRWQHPEHGLLAPGEFLHYMDGTELEVLVGEWVIDSVLQQMSVWSAQGIDCRVSANISADHLLRDNFSERLRMILRRHPGIAAERLELEILETAALADMKKAVETITQCRKLGVQFALDDFGTGYSSLTYFLNLPVQLLKIDQSFVRVMLEDPGGLGIVESVVRLAQAFNRPVIAEGVETLDHGAMLLHFGCQLAQGYGISRPMPADRVVPWLQLWRAEQLWRTITVPPEGRDVTLLVAAQSHATWVDKIALRVRHSDADDLPDADSNTCSFGRWYRGSGVTRYGRYPEYQQIATHHETSHALATRAILLAREGQATQANEVLEELYLSRDRMLGLIENLAAKPAGATLT